MASPRLVLLLRALNPGGAQRQAVVLAKGAARQGVDVHFVVCYGGHAFEAEVLESGIPVHNLGKSGRWDITRFWSRLTMCLDDIKPSAVYSFLPVPNLIASSLRLRSPRVRTVWGVRAADMDLTTYGWLPRAIFRLSAVASGTADAIIANSEAGRVHHVACGYPSERVTVVPNGIDTTMFKPDPAARARVRAEWQVSAAESLVGLVGRLDPVKDHPLFLRMAATIRQERSDVTFVCVGDGPSDYRRELSELSSSLGLAPHVRWRYAMDDMPAVFNGLDVLCSSSKSEAFSNVIAEAMASGVPCAVTPVGDSARIVGDTGVVATGNAPGSLKHATLDVMQRP